MAKRRSKKTKKRSKRSKGAMMKARPSKEELKAIRRRFAMKQAAAIKNQEEEQNPPAREAAEVRAAEKDKGHAGGNKKSKKKSKKKTKKKSNWMTCLSKARKQLGLKGFVAINKGKDGKALYKLAKELQVK
jgi:hypothetical protein